MKLAFFLAISVCLVYYSLQTTQDPQLEILGSGEYSFYSTQYVTSPLITKTHDMGFSYIYNCQAADAEQVRALFETIDGESITLENTSAVAVLKKLKYTKVSQSHLGSTDIVYAYSPRGKSFITNGDQKINLQIAENGSQITIGWPVILGSY